MTAFASTITARDFSQSTADKGRDTWTLGKMRHVIAASAGRPVVIVADASTGFTLVNVTLTGLSYRSHEGQGRVHVTHADQTAPSTTAYRLEDIGAVVLLEGSKFDAVKTYRDEVSAGIRAAQALHGAPEGRNWGRWAGEAVGAAGTTFPAAVDVTYTPHTGNPVAAEMAGGHGERGWFRIAAKDFATV